MRNYVYVPEVEPIPIPVVVIPQTEETRTSTRTRTSYPTSTLQETTTEPRYLPRYLREQIMLETQPRQPKPREQIVYVPSGLYHLLMQQPERETPRTQTRERMFPDIRGTSGIPRGQGPTFQEQASAWSRSVYETWVGPSTLEDVFRDIFLFWMPRTPERRAREKAYWESKSKEETARIYRQRAEQGEVAVVAAALITPVAVYGVQKYGPSLYNKLNKWATEKLPEPILRPYWKAKYWFQAQISETKQAWEEAFPRLFPKQPEKYPSVMEYGQYGYEPKGIPIPQPKPEPTGFTITWTRGQQITPMTRTLEHLLTKGKPLGGLSSKQLLQTEQLTKETIPSLPLVEFEPLFPPGTYRGGFFRAFEGLAATFPSANFGLALGGFVGLFTPQRLGKKQTQTLIPGQLQRQVQRQRERERETLIQRKELLMFPKTLQVQVQTPLLSQSQAQVQKQIQKQIQKQAQIQTPALMLRQAQALIYGTPSRQIAKHGYPALPKITLGAGPSYGMGKDLFGRWFRRQHPIKTPEQVAQLFGLSVKRRKGKRRMPKL